MWTIETRWFDVAAVMSLLAVGNILFGHFEQHKPSWRRLLKVAILLAVMLALVQTAGRSWAYGVLVLPLLGVAYIHFRWLPKHGVNGWTGEPRDKYLALVTRYDDNLFRALLGEASRSGNERPGR
jgi:predicted small integral membrane protein